MKKVAIIGSGVAGLASAIRLKVNGYDVEIFEKNSIVGGRMSVIKKNGFSFDVGPTIVMMPEIYKEVFTYASKNPDDYISMQELDPMYSLNYPNGEQVDASNHLTKMMKHLESVSEKDALGYLEYIADVYKRFLIAKKDFIEKAYRKPSDFYNFKSLVAAYKLKTLNSAYTSIAKFVKDENLRKALAFQTLYIGISPYTGPSIYTIIPMIELLYGVWYIKGGMYAYAKAMEKLFLELGGKIHFNTKVEEIVIDKKKVQGLLIDREIKKFDIVLSNADFPYAMKYLVKDEKDKGKYKTKKIEKMEYSSSSFMLYLGLDKKYPNLPVHNIRFAKDFDKNINDIFEDRIPDDPSFYLYSPSQIDESVAPSGKELLYVLVPVPNLHNSDNKWNKDLVTSYSEKILDMIEKVKGFEDIRKHIEVQIPFSPEDFKEKFMLFKGATFGLKPTLLQSNYFRPQNRSRVVKNLYFAGSSNHPGAGVPIVLTSAKLAVSEIIKDNK